MASANGTNLGAVLKKIWPQSAVTELFYKDAPLLAMLPKDESWVGGTREVVIQYGQISGRSSSFTTAKGNKNASLVTKMSIDTADNFAVWGVEHKFIMQTRNDKGALIRGLESQTKSAMKKLKRSMCWMIYGNGGGTIGRIATTTTLASTTLKFRDAASIRNVEVNDVLRLSSDDGSAASPAGVRTGSLTVTGVDPENLQVTVNVNISTGVSAATTGDYVSLDGDYAATIKGVEAYVPATAPTTSIWGMARTAQPRRLGGIRVGGKGLLIQEAVKKALSESVKESASISHVFMNQDDFLSLDLALGSNRTYVDNKVAGVGFTGIKFFSGQASPVEVYPDADCPLGVVRGFDMDTWKLASMGPMADFLNINGRTYEQEDSANSFEGRIGSYAQLYTEAPGANFRLDLNA